MLMDDDIFFFNSLLNQSIQQKLREYSVLFKHEENMNI